MIRATAAMVLLAGLLLGPVGCGGGGSDSAVANITAPAPVFGSPAPAWTAGVFRAPGEFANRCAAPRAGAFPDVQGTVLDENNWLRAWSNDLYLWYDEIIDRDPAAFATPEYFQRLKTDALTDSGRPKDRFHFSLATAEWEALSQSGISAGYGVSWALLSGTPPREAVVAFTEPGSPATQPSVYLRRGARVLEVDGVDLVNDPGEAAVAILNAGLFPQALGESHTFTVLDPGASVPRSITMTSVEVVSTPVQHVQTIATADGPVGYLLFNDHIATSEQALIDAIAQLDAAGVTDLVLDLRYNGGGFLDIASQLAFMVAGEGTTAGRAFERLRFNDKHPTINPVTGQPISDVPFNATSLGFSATAGQPLPSLNLPRLFVLTGPGTCSASESIINGLRGVGVEVIQIGSTTCGKPFGFFAAGNCGTTYFSIQFEGVNDQGEGGFGDGFSPGSAPGLPLPGCAVSDDFEHPLGSPDEARFAAALGYRETGSCPSLATASANAVSSGPEAIRREGPGATLAPPPVLSGKIMTPSR